MSAIRCQRTTVERTDMVRTRDHPIMGQKLSDAIVKTLPKPASGNKITYDSDVKGFGCRVTSGGVRSFSRKEP